MRQRKINLKQGQAMMIATVLFLMVSLTIIFGLVGPILKQQKIASQSLLSRQSYFLAEAGLEDVVYRLKTGQSVSATEVLTISPNQVTTVTTNTSSGKDVVATGDVSENVRKVEANLILGTGVAFNYGVQVGAGGFSLSNNAGVNGNVYSNSTIAGSNGSFITEGAVAVTSIAGVTIGTGTTGDTHAPTVTDSTVRGTLYCQTGSGNNKSCNTSLSNPVAEDFPIPEEQITTWKDEAAAGGTVGNQTFSGDNNILGPKKIQGDLNLSNGAKLKVTGTLWVTGNIVLSNSSELGLDPSYGSGDGVIVADGTSTLSNGASFSGSGTNGSYIMLLSTNNTGSAIVLSNNAGAIILYAPNGTIQLQNGAEVQQITAKTISLSNNAVLDYEQGLINASFTNGPGGGYDVSSWKEIE